MPPSAEGLASHAILGRALRTQPDRRLVTLVREGYEAAFEEIVRRYAKPLGRYAAAIVGGHSEDVTQDAFSKALLAMRRDGSEIELRPWLYRIVRNTALNDIRDRPPTAEQLEEAIEGGRSASEEAESREEVAELMSRLRALPEPQRAAIVMRELEGLGHEEIAAALGITGGAARQVIYRARVALRDGFGLLIPLPLLRALADHGAEATVAGASGLAAGASGAGGALKLGVATALIAGSVGTGLAFHENNHRGAEATATAHSTSASGPSGESATGSALVDVSGSLTDGNQGEGNGGHSKDSSGREEGSGRGEPGPSEDSGGGGRSEAPQSGASQHDPGPSGGGSGSGDSGDGTSGGPGPGGSGSSGPGGGGDGGGSGGDDRSGSQPPPPPGDDLLSHDGGGPGPDSGSGSGSGLESSVQGGDDGSGHS